jgi:hypothetical protein
LPFPMGCLGSRHIVASNQLEHALDYALAYECKTLVWLQSVQSNHDISNEWADVMWAGCRCRC